MFERSVLCSVPEVNEEENTVIPAASKTTESDHISDGYDLKQWNIGKLIERMHNDEERFAKIRNELDWKRGTNPNSVYRDALQKHTGLLKLALQASEKDLQKLNRTESFLSGNTEDTSLDKISVRIQNECSSSLLSFLSRQETSRGLMLSSQKQDIPDFGNCSVIPLCADSRDNSFKSPSAHYDHLTSTPFPQKKMREAPEVLQPPLVPTGRSFGNPRRFAEFPAAYMVFYNFKYCDCGHLEYLECRTAWLEQTRLLAWQSRTSDRLLPGIIRDFHNAPAWFPKSRMKWSRKLEMEATEAVDSVLKKFLERWMEKQTMEQMSLENEWEHGFDVESIPEDICELLHYYDMHPLQKAEQGVFESRA